MGLSQGTGMPYVVRGLLSGVDADEYVLWVADAMHEMHEVAREGLEAAQVAEDLPPHVVAVRTPADPDVPAVAVLAVKGGPSRDELQALLDDASDTLAALAQIHESQARMGMVEGILEAVGEQAAVLDESGVVVRANCAWTTTPAAHRAVVDRSEVGANYPAALRDQSTRAARIAAEGIQAVLDGSLPSFQSDHDTDVDSGDRSYSMQVDPLPLGGAVVRHVDISFRKHLQRELAHRATHDPLTGLPNRMVMMDRLGQALVRASRTGSRVALLFCDVDRFKQINDSKGHAAGDQVLEAVARRLQNSVRQSDVVARFGGDEFVVLLDDIPDAEAAHRRAADLQKAATQPIVVDGEHVNFGLSIGLAVHKGEADLAGPTVQALLGEADSAMYAAKEVGGGAIRVAAAA